MRIGVIIPDRGDRPEFLLNCLRMLRAQTVQPSIVKIVNEKPKSESFDITYRYRIGYIELSKKKLDCILLMENDDYYAPNYIERICQAWHDFGCPDIFGIGTTIYYHLKERKWMQMYHPKRASAMNTLLAPKLKINWCADDYPFTDLYLWGDLRGTTFNPVDPISIGIKHGIGKCGGNGHREDNIKYVNSDYDFDWLRSNMDSQSFNFYSNIFQCTKTEVATAQES